MSFIRDNLFEKDNPKKIQTTRILQLMCIFAFPTLFVLECLDKVPADNAARLWVVIFTGLGVYLLNKTKLVK